MDDFIKQLREMTMADAFEAIEANSAIRAYAQSHTDLISAAAAHDRLFSESLYADISQLEYEDLQANAIQRAHEESAVFLTRLTDIDPSAKLFDRSIYAQLASTEVSNFAITNEAYLASLDLEMPWDKQLRELFGDYDIEETGDEEEVDEEVGNEEQKAEGLRSDLIEVKYLPVRLVQALLNHPEDMMGLTWREFEKLIAELAELDGAEDVELLPSSGDGGRDVVATFSNGGITTSVAYEAKHWKSKKVGVDVVRGLRGVISTPETEANKGVICTTSTFTEGAQKILIATCTLQGLDHGDLVKKLKEHSKKLR